MPAPGLSVAVPVAAAAGTPTAAPSASPVPIALPVAGTDPPLDAVFARLRESSEGPLPRRQKRRLRGRGKFVALALLLAAAIGGGIAALPWLQKQMQEDEILPGPGVTSTEFNFRFAVPASAWEEDKSQRGVMQANLVIRRTDPNAWLAIAAHDYKTRTPRDAEVADEAVRRLSSYFQDLGWEPKEDAQLAGRRAQRLSFQGEVNHVLMSGECSMLGYKGIAYWLITWAPAAFADRVSQELTEIRGRFALLKQREGWSEKRPSVRMFEGPKVPYSLRDTEGIWEKWEPAEVDAQADLFLQGKDRAEAKAVDRMASVLVLLLPQASDLQAAVAEAKAHLEAQQKKVYPNTTMEVLGDKSAEEDTVAVGDARGRVLKLHVKNGETRHRFVLLAVIPQPNQVLVIQGECDLKRRSLWERDFNQLLSTFRLKGN